MKHPMPKLIAPSLQDSEIILALDPSSQAIGYALMDASFHLLVCGVILPAKRDMLAMMRIEDMVAYLPTVIERFAREGRTPTRVLVEVMTEPQYSRQPGRVSALVVCANAQAAAWWECRRMMPGKTYWIPNTWCRGQSKRVRLLTAMTYKNYNPAEDTGMDASDAICIARWWLSKQALGFGLTQGAVS